MDIEGRRQLCKFYTTVYLVDLTKTMTQVTWVDLGVVWVAPLKTITCLGQIRKCPSHSRGRNSPHHNTSISKIMFTS